MPHVLWVYVQGITSLGHNPYTSILLIQASEQPVGGTRFDENYKTIKPFSGWYRLLGEEQYAIDVLPCIPQVHGCMDKD